MTRTIMSIGTLQSYSRGSIKRKIGNIWRLDSRSSEISLFYHIFVRNYWCGDRCHPKLISKFTHHQVVAALLTKVWIRDEWGFYHLGAVNPLLYLWLVVNCKPDQHIKATMGIWNGFVSLALARGN